MKKPAYVYILLTCSLLLFFTTITNAQLQTWIRYDIGFSFDKTTISVGEPRFLFSPGRNVIYGGYLEQEITRRFSVETGFASKHYGYTGYYRDTGASEIIAAYDYLQIPLRIRYRQNLGKSQLAVVPAAGISYFFTHKLGLNDIRTGWANGFDIHITQPFRRNLLLLEAGLALEHPLGKRWKIGLDLIRYFPTGQKLLTAYEVTNKPISQEIETAFTSMQLKVGFGLWKKAGNRSRKI